MERGKKMNSIDEIIPNDEDYPIINLLFQNKLLKSREINTNTLIITCLDLISRERINIRTNDEIETIRIDIFKYKFKTNEKAESKRPNRFKDV